MSKDVDLSSKEWRDLVFEGRNQEYGAYDLRKNSDKRHNKSMILVIIALALIIVVGLTFNTVSNFIFQEDIKDEANQELVNVNMAAEEEEEEEEEQERVEMEQPEALPEEILNTIKVTELAIVEDSEVTPEDEIKSQDELKETQTAFGQTNFDQGTDDRNVVREHKEEIIVEEKKPEKEEVFRAVEQMPQFPGGDAELMKFLRDNIVYPAMAQENNVQGKVIVQFVVTKTGDIGEVKVVKSVDRDLDNEAVRLVKKLPKFIPGRMNGQAVNVWYTLPVQFKLQ
ncbi:MAG: energy transducer TonB [Muribaculaceae bacterium]|nr:energy transducer TonB [Muribaculaceae bacterium]MDY3932992.1 energy transducer TonB [Muribaculaceae bacterium]